MASARNQPPDRAVVNLTCCVKLDGQSLKDLRERLKILMADPSSLLNAAIAGATGWSGSGFYGVSVSSPKYVSRMQLEGPEKYNKG
jgi:hypothetical protein